MAEVTTDLVRERYGDAWDDYRDLAEADFDRWLADVKAAVLREAAAATFAHTTIGQKGERTQTQRPILSADVRKWLEARADVIAASPDVAIGDVS